VGAQPGSFGASRRLASRSRASHRRRTIARSTPFSRSIPFIRAYAGSGSGADADATAHLDPFRGRMAREHVGGVTQRRDATVHDGQRAGGVEVVAHPRTREIYLGE